MKIALFFMCLAIALLGLCVICLIKKINCLIDDVGLCLAAISAINIVTNKQIDEQDDKSTLRECDSVEFHC